MWGGCIVNKNITNISSPPSLRDCLNSLTWAPFWRIWDVKQQVKWLSECMLPTNKCWHSPPFRAYIITTAGLHFKSIHSQWSEPWLSCNDSGCGRSIHHLFIAATFLVVPETNLIFCDVSSMYSISWWIPFQCHRRLVWVYSCYQVLNWVGSESCRISCSLKGIIHF